MVAAGICVSIQGPINARLRLAVGSPVPFSWIRLGGIGLLILCVFLVQFK
jgi:uncharacterized membrane protein YdcZ (DUF606 family)